MLLHAVVDDGMIPFAAYTTAEVPMLFSRLDILQKLLFHWGISSPIWCMVPWAHSSQPCQTTSLSVQPFL